MFYLIPKKFMEDMSYRLPEARLFTYEDVTKSNDLFNEANEETLLVFDRSARYKMITNNTFVRLSRIASQYKHKVMIDIVPFTSGVEYLYSPLAFIDRGILGYQHWYSYRENNWEQQGNNRVRAHDFDLLAAKLAEHADIDYADFLGNQVVTVDCSMTKFEAAEYKQLRDRMFEENKTASPIITTLADWTNIRESRYAALGSLLTRPGNTAVYTNLAGHNKRLQKRFPGVNAKSFYDTNGDEGQYDRVILFETPIVRGYLFLDVIANVRPDCEIYIFRSDSTVDRMLYKRVFEEYNQINALASALYREVRQ